MKFQKFFTKNTQRIDFFFFLLLIIYFILNIIFFSFLFFSFFFKELSIADFLVKTNYPPQNTKCDWKFVPVFFCGFFQHFTLYFEWFLVIWPRDFLFFSGCPAYSYGSFVESVWEWKRWCDYVDDCARLEFHSNAVSKHAHTLKFLHSTLFSLSFELSECLLKWRWVVCFLFLQCRMRAMTTFRVVRS